MQRRRRLSTTGRAPSVYNTFPLLPGLTHAARRRWILSHRPCSTLSLVRGATTGFLPGRSSQFPTRPDQPSCGACSIISETRRSWVRATGYSGEVEQRFRGSGTRIPAKWNARRSVATFVGQFPPLGVATGLQDSTRDVVFESMDEDACGACGRRLRRPRCCGKRAFGDRSVAPNASRAFSTTPARCSRVCEVVVGVTLRRSPTQLSSPVH